MALTHFPYGISSFGWPVLPNLGLHSTTGRTYWVDGTYGNDGKDGRSPETALKTVGQAVTTARDGRGDVILVMPGSYAETIDVTKQDLKIVGVPAGYNGRVQIIGDGSTARATIRVLDAYLRGFYLANIELDTNGLDQIALHLQTNNATASPNADAAGLRFMIENVAVRSNDPDTGILLQGATSGILRRLHIEGPNRVGIAISGSPTNLPTDLLIEDVDFMDVVTADIATVDAAGNAPTVANIGASVGLTNVSFRRIHHWDRGGTPVTDFVNMVGTMVNTHFFDCYAARDVADGTLIHLPANVVWLGYSAAAAEFIIGS